MKKIISISIISILIFSSCGADHLSVVQKKFGTFTVKEGTLTINDTIIASIEWETTSDLAFKASGRISDIYVRPGEKVKAWQVLARLGNKESLIQVDALSKIENELVDLGLSTNAVKVGTQNMGTSLAKLYDKRIAWLDNTILSLQNNLEKAKQNLGNQNATLPITFLTLAHDFDRVTSNMLHEWDKILWLTTNFEYTNDAWEAYLGTRLGSAKSEADSKWWVLYAGRGKVRTYFESWATISDINTAISDLRNAYNDARIYASSMNTMLQNSVIWWGLPEEKLNAWISAWLGYSSDEQQSEARFIAWKNEIQNLTNIQNGSGSVAQKDITSIELELKNLQISRETLLAEKDSKLKEIKTNVDTVQSKKWEVSVQIEQARMNASLAGESVEYNIIRAPFDGIVLEKNMEIGNVVSAGIPIMKVSSQGKYIIKTYIDNDMYKYKVGSPLVIENIATQEVLSGSISLIQKEKDPLHNKNYTEIEIKNTDQSLGERVIIKLARSKTPYQNGTIIPLESIITRYGPPGVFLYKESRATFTLVNIVWSDLRFAEVIGIPEWSVIITSGKENILDGEVLKMN